MKKNLLFYCVLLTALTLSARAEVEVHEDLVYATYGERELMLDLFKPSDQTRLLPAIIGVHGGGWRKGSKRNFARHARYFAEHGYVAVSINYRLSGEAKFPAHIEDCKAAVRWLRANADKYGIDPDRIGAIGHSAGGHLVSLLATSSGVAELEGEGGNQEFSSAIQAAVPMGAQSDFETPRIRALTAQPGGSEIWINFMGGSLDEQDALYKLASPHYHLDAEDPPQMFITGEKDNTDTHAVPIRTSMVELEIPSGLLIIPEAPHPFLPVDRFRDLALTTALFFFDSYLKGEE
ncbi:MAG: hypothetical protein SynsKO_16970 [Synoicihabitans sp.]